eukprot:CAMPEP_0197179248 /NCGR_PEP_ID=MMETSP1423-20130617/4270_1 /TAXON_ID=476441 /ORGANISM="Pseudo-nitzschia heimii, Strain UNC1101" /LENGTH=224 /DNA_ID=CAMNT_0042629137 /DNA_START=28 /DNA_END=702 /DNA_ORIENTATION=-
MATSNSFAKVVAVFLFVLEASLVAAGSSSHHHRKTIDKRQVCKDRPEVHCRLIVDDGDCDKFTIDGENYGNDVCPASCGTCGEVPDKISADQTCYTFAKQSIVVKFSNSIPHLEDWVGIYPDTADPKDLGSPVAWYWLCGDKKHKCSTSVGFVIFPWLPPGTYKAVLSRNRDAKGPYANYGPFRSYAESERFEVARGEMCASRRLVEDSNSGGAVRVSLRGTNA